MKRIINGRNRREKSSIVWLLSENEFGKCIGCIFSAPPFSVGGDKLWVNYDANKNINGIKIKKKCRNILGKIDIFEVCS